MSGYKYLADGHQVSIVKVVDGGVIASRLYEVDYSGDGDHVEIEGERIYYDDSQLFDTPPKDKLETELLKLRNEISEAKLENSRLYRETVALREDAKKAERENVSIISQHKRALEELPINHAQLTSLKLYMEGGIKWIVKHGEGMYRMPELIDATSKSKAGCYHVRDFNLLRFVGNIDYAKTHDACWKLQTSNNRDFRGYDVSVHATYEEAKEAYALAMDVWAKEGRNLVEADYISSLESHGLKPSEFAANKFKRGKEAESKAKREKAEAAIAAAQAELNEVES